MCTLCDDNNQNPWSDGVVWSEMRLILFPGTPSPRKTGGCDRGKDEEDSRSVVMCRVDRGKKDSVDLTDDWWEGSCRGRGKGTNLFDRLN